MDEDLKKEFILALKLLLNHAQDKYQVFPLVDISRVAKLLEQQYVDFYHELRQAIRIQVKMNEKLISEISETLKEREK